MKHDQDAGWILPSTALIGVVACLAVWVRPNVQFLGPGLYASVVCTGVGWIIGGLWFALKIVQSRASSPLAEVPRVFERHRYEIKICILTVGLAAVAMMVFTWVKTLLNLHVSFWADPALAQMDNMLFLGHDPQQLLKRFNTEYSALIYHQGWFFALFVALLITAASPPSPEKSAVLLSYFVLWLVIGPVIHTLVPAGGPIFFARLGYGDRFASLIPDSDSELVANYLWLVYVERGSLPGSGISAMPSLHIAMVTWWTFALRLIAPRLFIAGLLFGLIIFAMSIALGWHYAVDGIVGAALAIGTVALLRRLFLCRQIQGLRDDAKYNPHQIS